MDPGPIFLIRQNLHKAFRLGKPGRAAVTAFQTRLEALLEEAGGKRNKAATDLRPMLPDSWLGCGEEQPRNSSPVCYADAPNLREGFEDNLGPEPPASGQFGAKVQPGGPLNRFLLNDSLKEALQATRFSIHQILAILWVSPQACPCREKQITALVYELFALTPEEINYLEAPRTRS